VIAGAVDPANDPVVDASTSTAVAPNSSNEQSSSNNNSNNNNEEWGANLEDHPDPNDEHYDGMIYVGKHDERTGRRLGFDTDNGIRYIFGTSFDETHKQIEEKDLLEHPLRPVHDIPEHEREKVLKERRHKALSPDEKGKIQPKPFGHVDVHPLDGGVVPPKVVHVEPFFLDETPVTNKEFGKFVRATYYETEAEKYGWSFVLESMVDPETRAEMQQDDEHETDPEAEHWVAVKGAYWRRPEGPKSSYKYRENHPVVHVSHRDAAEYCKWVGKRLPGEWEWEAAARAGHYGPSNRTLFAWGDEDDNWELASKHANLWGPGAFPFENDGLDGYRGTSQVKYYPPNALGFYDMTGNVWEWQRGGKHKARIVRGGSFVDSLNGTVNHAATLGARSTIHATTTTANVGFRCAKAPKRRTEYHYVYHDEELHGQLAIEDQFGKRDTIPQLGWEDQYIFDDEEEELDDEELPEIEQTRKKKKVLKKRERYSNEL
jgi:formylglycine-generating enzyme required for sulfatase activity